MSVVEKSCRPSHLTISAAAYGSRLKAGTTTEYAFSFSRRDAPGVLKGTLPPKNQRAQGRPGARCTRGLAGVLQKICCPRAYRFSGEHPAFPAQWLYGLYEIVLVTLPFVTPSLSGSVGRLRT